MSFFICIFAPDFKNLLNINNMSVNPVLPNCGIEQMCNKNFNIRIDGNGHHQFCTFSGLVDVIGRPLAKRLVLDAFSRGLDVWTRNLRRGLKIEFVAK